MLGWALARDVTPELRDRDILLRGARNSDFAAWQSVRRQSWEFLKPFEPRWGEADLKKVVFDARLRRCRSEAKSGHEYSFLIFLCDGDDQVLVGGITLSNIRRRSAQMANLGYWMSAESAGNGIMTRAVGMLLPFVFNTLRLHRIQAACLPHNIASRCVLEKNGFREEGYAENYLQIDGAWQDHVLYALSRERYEGHRV